MADETVYEGINSRVAQGFSLVLSLQGSCERKTAVFEEVPGLEGFAVRVGLGIDAWKDLAKRLGISLSCSSALLSPTGKVLKQAQDESFIFEEAKRFAGCVAKAVAETKPRSPSPVRHSADEWIQASSRQGLSQHKRVDPSASESVEPVSADAPTKNVKSQNPAEVPKVQTKSTKVGLKFTDGTPRQVISVDDTSKVTLQNVLDQAEVRNIQALILEYPRRRFDLATDSSKTLEELGLSANPSLLVTTASANPSNAIAVPGTLNTIVSTVYGWIMMVIAWIVKIFKSFLGPQQAPTNARLRANAREAGNAREERKVNQYWNGDSTVFEGPADDTNDKTD